MSGFLGVNGSPATSFPFEAYINSSTAYTSTSRGNVMRVYNSNTGANVFAGIELGGAGTANDGLAGLNAIVTGSGSAALTFYTRDGGTFAERVRVAANGKVGIGTTNPDNTYQGLTIFGSDPSLRLRTSSSGGWTWTEYVNSSGVNNFSVGVNQAAPFFGIKAGAGMDNPNFVVTSGGNVGIGTSSPSYLLDVNGIASSTTEYRLNASFTRVATKDSGGGFGGGYNFNWNNGSPIHDSTGSLSGYGYASDGSVRFYSNSSAAANTAAPQRLTITSGGALQLDQSTYFLCGTTGYRFNNSTNSFNNFVALDNGNATLRGTLTQNASDERLKNNIQLIPDALNKINSLRGVTFEWNQEIYETSRTTDIGVIAQDIQAVLPDAVTLAPFDTNFDDGTSKSGEDYLTVYYEKIIPLLIEGMKELSAKVSALENKS
jgi:hypothetical protein